MPEVMPMRVLAALLIVAFGTVALAACDRQGPAEELGEKIDESVESAGDAIEDATDK